jgi:hypothetical protein
VLLGRPKPTSTTGPSRRGKALTTFAEYVTFDAAPIGGQAQPGHELFVWAPDAAVTRIILDEASAGRSTV